MLMQIPQEYNSKISEFADEKIVPVLELAESFGIKVLMTDEMADEESGAIVKDADEKFTIYVNKRHPANRIRFTIAHEIGHFMKHKDKFQPGEVHLDRTVPMHANMLKRDTSQILSSEQRKMEAEANALAAEILMPRKQFVETYNEQQAANGIEGVAREFGVSSRAAEIRASELFGLVAS